MKAIVFRNYGSPEVLHLEDVEKPSPKDNEVLIKIYAASINYVDWQVLRGKSILLRTMNGLLKPRKNILGDDVAGVVEAVGANVEQFEPGDGVFGISNYDAFAEYACVPEEHLVLKPASISFEKAAALPYAGMTALQGLRDNGQIQAGKNVLIIGASGGVGTYAVQIAKSYGAVVTGVCRTEKLDMVRSIGADEVIDYTQEDFTQNGQHYDLIFAVGGNRSIFDYQRTLSPEGNFVCAGGSASQYFQGFLLGPLLSILGGKKLSSMYANPNKEDYGYLIQLVEAGEVAPVIDRCYPLHEVPEALRFYGAGRTKGKIVITVEHNN